MTRSPLYSIFTFCAMTVALSNTARAADGDIVLSSPTTLVGNTGKVTVGEIEAEVEFGGQLFPAYVAYFLDVLDPSTEVAAFAVSGDVYYFESFPGARPSAVTSFAGWSAIALRRNDWNSGYEFSIGGTTTMTTNSLGTAASLFGHDRAISLYYLSDGGNTIFDDGSNANDQDAEAWEIEDPADASPLRFWATTQRRSEFVALDINGQVIDFSIPEPSTLAMMMFVVLSLTKRQTRIA